MQIKALFSKIRNTNYIYAVLIIGIAVMLFASAPTKNIKKDTSSQNMYSDEERLCEILSEISGAGNVRVMVTYFGGTQKNPAYEKKSTQKTALQSEEESTDEKVVLSDGSPFILEEVYPEVKGVVVIAEGAHNAEVKKAIQEAVVTAMGIAAHRVCILY